VIRFGLRGRVGPVSWSVPLNGGRPNAARRPSTLQVVLAIVVTVSVVGLFLLVMVGG
jgi:hypothetical protein